MRYDFSRVIQNTDELLREFIDSYTACVDINGDMKIAHVIERYSKIFDKLNEEFNSEELIDIYTTPRKTNNIF